MKSFLSLAALIGASTLTAAQNNPLVIGDEAVYVYEPLVATATGPAAAAAAAMDDCNYDTVKDLCDNLPGKYNELSQICKILGVTSFLSKKNSGQNNLLDKDKFYTLFLSRNKGVATLFIDILEQGSAGSTILSEFIEYGLVAGSLLDPQDLECKSKVSVVSTTGKPKIFCKDNISGYTNAYLKGKKNTKYVPRFVDPSEVITTVCNAHIYLMTDVILLNLPE